MDRSEAYNKYRHDQIKFCDETVRQFIPKFIQNFTDKLGESALKRAFYAVVDVVYLSKILKIRIENLQNRELLAGKGFRNNFKAFKITSITTKIFKGDKEIASKTFPINFIVK